MLYEQIKEQIKDAMKNKDTDKRDVLKLVVDKARGIMKQNNPNEVIEDIPDSVIITAIEKEIKQMNQTLDSIGNSACTNHLNLRSSLSHKITLLSDYLPKKLTEKEVRERVEQILSQGDYKDMGQKMKACMTEFKGQANGSVIRRIVMSL